MSEAQQNTNNDAADGPSTNNTRGRNVRGTRRGNRSRGGVTHFKGGVPAAQGKTFQSHSEQSKTGQFKDTLEALKVLAATEYKKDVLYLEPLFNKLDKSSVRVPVRPIPITEYDDDGAETVFPIPETDLDIYREEVKAFVTEKRRLEATTTALYNIAWSQCSQLMRDKLKAVAGYKQINEDCDISGLLQEIRSICHQVERNICIHDSLDELQRQFFAYRQQSDQTNSNHLEVFRDYIEVMEHFGIDMFRDRCCLGYEQQQDMVDNISGISEIKYLQRIKERRLAVFFPPLQHGGIRTTDA